MQFGFTVIKTENFAVLVLMVAYSLAKAKEGVRISYTAQDSGNIQQVLIFYFRQIVIPFNVGSIPTLPTINKQK